MPKHHHHNPLNFTEAAYEIPMSALDEINLLLSKSETAKNTFQALSARQRDRRTIDLIRLRAEIASTGKTIHLRDMPELFLLFEKHGLGKTLLNKKKQVVGFEWYKSMRRLMNLAQQVVAEASQVQGRVEGMTRKTTTKTTPTNDDAIRTTLLDARLTDTQKVSILKIYYGVDH